MKEYRVNEVFYSLQGEGMRAGTANVFVRFAGCNLTCRKEDEGFDCDTEFASGVGMTTQELELAIRAEIGALAPPLPAPAGVILTGGEPALQVDAELVDALRAAGFYVCMETNGTREVPKALDWVSVSPKTAEHTLRVGWASELRYVRHRGQAIPRPQIEAGFRFVSPAWSDDPRETQSNIAWCVELVKSNPSWRLSLQTHKLLGVR